MALRGNDMETIEKTVLGFFVLPEYEGRGIGRGIFSDVLRNADVRMKVSMASIQSGSI